MSEEIAAIHTRLLRGRGVVSPHPAARDIAAMTRGLIDAAGLVGETDDAALLARLRSAIMRYLTVAGSS
jgi:TRAP-type mannitol/chloroaromatic compound transport system substrate-binding protein